MSKVVLHNRWTDFVDSEHQRPSLFNDTDEDFLFYGNPFFLDDNTMAMVSRTNQGYGGRYITAIYDVSAGYRFVKANSYITPAPYDHQPVSPASGDVNEPYAGLVQEGLLAVGLDASYFLRDYYYDDYDQRPLFGYALNKKSFGSMHFLLECMPVIQSRRSRTQPAHMGRGDWLFSPLGFMYYVVDYSFDGPGAYGNQDGTGHGDQVEDGHPYENGIAVFKFTVSGPDRVTLASSAVLDTTALGESSIGRRRSTILMPDGRIFFITGVDSTAVAACVIAADLSRIDAIPSITSPADIYGDVASLYATGTGDGHVVLFRIQSTSGEIQSIDMLDSSFTQVGSFSFPDGYGSEGALSEESIRLGASLDTVFVLKPNYGVVSNLFPIISFNGETPVVNAFSAPQEVSTLVAQNNTQNESSVVAINTDGSAYFFWYTSLNGESKVGIWSARTKDLPGVWTAVSGDSGATWTNNVKLPTRQSGETRRSDGLVSDDEYHIYNMSAVRTPGGLTLVGSVHRGYVHDVNDASGDVSKSPPNSGSRNSLIIANYQDLAATSSEVGVVFKRERTDR